MKIKKLERSGKRLVARAFSLFFRPQKISAGGIDPLDIKRILIVRQHDQLGDMLLSVPAFRGLRKRFSGAEISLVASPVSYSVVKNNPYLDEVILYDKRNFRLNPFTLVGFLAGLRRRNYDLAIVLNTVSFSLTSMIIALFSGARIVAGCTSEPFGCDYSRRFYSLELPLPSAEELEGMHEGAHNLYPLRAIGVEESDLASIIVPDGGEARAADRFIRAAVGEGEPFVVIHPGAGKKRNRWPAERFAEISLRLLDRYHIKTIAVAGPMDSEPMGLFLRSVGNCPTLVSNPSIDFLAALMRRALLVLCNDTGVLHIAGAVGARCIAIFGPTEASRWKPANESVIAVSSKDGSIESVTVDDVFNEAERIVGQWRARE